MSTLEALPSIHSSLVGFGGSLYLAYAAYVYGIVDKETIEIEELAEELSNLSTINHHRGLFRPGQRPQRNELVSDDGVLNFAQVFEEFLCLVLPSRRSESISDREIVEGCEVFLDSLYHIMVTFPFNGRINPLVANNFADVSSKIEGALFNEERIRWIRQRIVQSINFWNSEQKNLEAFFALAAHAALRHRENLVNEELEQINSDHPYNVQQARLHRREIAEIRVPPVVDYKEEAKNYLSRLQEHQDILNALGKAVTRRSVHMRRLPVKAISVILLGACAFILVFGVFGPLAIQGLHEYSIIPWNTWADIVLVGLTSLPYFAGITWLTYKAWRKG